jgi:hypothetical protein
MSISQLLLIGLIIGLGLGIFVVRYFDNPIRNFIAKLTPPKIRFSEESFNILEPDWFAIKWHTKRFSIIL